ncbi:hypothetical protein CUJ86_11580 [Methanofollis fontis]|uniref:Uncharacterized protein n=2 Tax=Methanofollis fontis TaxID=2052832 RepID=A0A483CKM8_9EURY|nr:hypothetical protein CUJ86_11580 [Methanofollis fontis]
MLYDADPEEIGKETFKESLCAGFARVYSGNWSGYATSSFMTTALARSSEKRPSGQQLAFMGPNGG